jgi:large subunit ribosomal protein L24e
VKAQLITWTTAWRRMNKKIKTDELVKKRRKRQIKVQRAIVGISLDELKKTRNAPKELKEA